MKTKYDSMCHYDFALHLMPQLEACLPAHWSDGLSTQLVNTLVNAGVRSYGDAVMFLMEQNELRGAHRARNYGLAAEKELAAFLNIALPPKRGSKNKLSTCPHCGHSFPL
jgi:hypothetical protein